MSSKYRRGGKLGRREFTSFSVDEWVVFKIPLEASR